MAEAVRFRYLGSDICFRQDGRGRIATSGERASEAEHFQTGTICRVRDLKGRPELNGEDVFVREFDTDSGRYVCDRRISDADEERTVLKLMEVNLELLGRPEYTLGELQRWIDECPASKRLCLPRGRWQDAGADASPAGAGASGAGKLSVKKPLVICGLGSDEATGTVWSFPVELDCEDKRATFAWHDFRVCGTVEIKGKKLDGALLKGVTIVAPAHGRDDALHLNGTTSQRDKSSGKPKSKRKKKKHWDDYDLFLSDYKPDRVLLDQCTILGGADGIHVNCPDCTMRKCTIRGAGSRGIFVSEDCVIEDSVVEGCGSYGVKTRASLTRQGKNRIQAGPWDDQPWNVNVEDGHLERLLAGGGGGHRFGEGDDDMYGGLGGMGDMYGGLGGMGSMHGGLGGFPGGFPGMGGFGDEEDDMFAEYGFLRPDGDVEIKDMYWLRDQEFDDELAPGLYGCRSTWNSLTEQKRKRLREEYALFA